jgi:Rps23 Pro-64 3,4-dihydroxylase Tpa1-like proline 4-hydroxylase
LPAEQRRSIATDVQQAAAARSYAVRFNQFDILHTYLAKSRPDSLLDHLLETINAAPFLELMRRITGIDGLIKADAQATLFAPGDFLSLHNDSHKDEGWRVAYVLNLAEDDWSPDWGGYLNFFDVDGDIVAGWRLRFNALNLFLVPQPHHVSYVPPFATEKRFAITGWLRDR